MVAPKKIRMPIDGNELAKRWGIEPLDLAYVMLNHELYFTDFDENKVHILYLIEDVENLKELNIPISAYQMDVVDAVEKELDIGDSVPLVETIRGSDVMKRWGKTESDIQYLIYQYGLKPVDPFGYPVAEKYVLAFLRDNKVTVHEFLFLVSDIEEMESQIEGLEPKDTASEEEPKETPEANDYSFYKEGDYWKIGPVGREFNLKDITGFHQIRFLLRNPGKPFPAHVVENFGYAIPGGTGKNVEGDLTSRSTKEAGGRGEGYLTAQSGPEMALKNADPKAIKAVRDELKDLKDRRAQSTDFDERDRMDAQIGQLEKYLLDAERSSGSSEEGSRVRVLRNIKRAIEHIKAGSKESTELSAMTKLLKTETPGRTVYTGHECCYRPLTLPEIIWILDPPS